MTRAQLVLTALLAAPSAALAAVAPDWADAQVGVGMTVGLVAGIVMLLWMTRRG